MQGENQEIIEISGAYLGDCRELTQGNIIELWVTQDKKVKIEVHELKKKFTNITKTIVSIKGKNIGIKERES